LGVLITVPRPPTRSSPFPYPPLFRSEPDEGHRVKSAEALHHQVADLLRGDLALAGALELAHDATHHAVDALGIDLPLPERHLHRDRKSTRLNSSHVKISYAVFCLKKK